MNLTKNVTSSKRCFLLLFLGLLMPATMLGGAEVAFDGFSSDDELQAMAVCTSAQIHFSVQEELIDILVSYISQAQHTCYVMAYYLTNGKIVNALLQAHSNGAQVRIIADTPGMYFHDRATKGPRTNSAIHTLFKAKIAHGQMIDIWLNETHEYKTFHHKLLIIDDVVITGSFNFSKNAESHHENIIIVSDPKVAIAATQAFWFTIVKNECVHLEDQEQMVTQSSNRSMKLYQKYKNRLKRIEQSKGNGNARPTTPCPSFELSQFSASQPISSQPATPQIYFSVTTKLQDIIIKQIEASTERCFIMAYCLTNRAIIAALLEAHRRGVAVSIIYNHLYMYRYLPEGNARTLECMHELYNEPPNLHNRPIELYIFDLKSRTKFHHKVIVCDHKVITGSFNFSEGARSNDENLVVVEDPRLAGQAYYAFAETKNQQGVHEHTNFTGYKRPSAEKASRSKKRRDRSSLSFNTAPSSAFSRKRRRSSRAYDEATTPPQGLTSPLRRRRRTRASTASPAELRRSKRRKTRAGQNVAQRPRSVHQTRAKSFLAALEEAETAPMHIAQETTTTTTTTTTL